jgi:hypothetical protein
MNNLHPIARAVQSQGRGNDSQLIHMTPGEIQGLQAIAMAHGGSLSTNPNTGLPEAGFLSDILPAIAGFALGPAGFGLSTLQASMAVGGLKAITSGSLAEGISAGFGAWGGSELGGAVAGMGSGAIGGQAAANATTKAALQNKAGAGAVANAARDQAIKEATKSQMLQEGARAVMSDPTQLVGALGGTGKTAAIYNAIGAPFAIETATGMPEQKSKPVSVSQMKYRSNYRGPEEGEARNTGERNWFDGEYVKTGEKVYGAAGGGIMGFAGEEGSFVNPAGIETITQMPGDAPIVRKRPTPAAGKVGYSSEMTDDDGKKYRLKYDPKTGEYTREYSEVDDDATTKGAKEVIKVDSSGGEGGSSSDEGGAKGDPKGRYSDFLSTPIGKMVARAVNTISPGDPRETPAPVENRSTVSPDAVTEAAMEDARSEAEKAYADQTESNKTADTEYSGPDTAEKAGYSGTAKGGLISLARGGALRFAQAGSVPDTRIYKQPTQNAMGDEVPDQTAQKLAAANLQKQQLANQATDFVSPSAMIPNTKQYTSPTGIASGYVPNRAANYTAATPKTFQAGLTALQPKKDLPGGFSGYGADSFVRQPAVVPNVGGTFPGTTAPCPCWTY